MREGEIEENSQVSGLGNWEDDAIYWYKKTGKSETDMRDDDLIFMKKWNKALSCLRLLKWVLSILSQITFKYVLFQKKFVSVFFVPRGEGCYGD